MLIVTPFQIANKTDSIISETWNCCGCLNLVKMVGWNIKKAKTANVMIKKRNISFTMMNSYLITRYFSLANEALTVSFQNGMQKYKPYAKDLQKNE